MSLTSAGTRPADLVRALLRTRTTLLADVDLDPDAPERLLVRSDLSGTMQLYELRGGDQVQLTALPEPVATAQYLPGTRRALLAIDRGGDERHQLYLLDLDQAADQPVSELDRLHAVTSDPRFGHYLAGAAPDGSWIAYLSNRANGVDFDLWVCDLASDEHACAMRAAPSASPLRAPRPTAASSRCSSRATVLWTSSWCSSKSRQEPR